MMAVNETNCMQSGLGSPTFLVMILRLVWGRHSLDTLRYLPC